MCLPKFNYFTGYTLSTVTNQSCETSINPAKIQLKLDSRKLLTKIMGNVANTIKVNQWWNTTTVIDWFKSLLPKDKTPFIKFDIEEFYPPMSEELLSRSISFARSMATISDSVISIIKHSRTFPLFDEISIWVKKEVILTTCKNSI